MKRTFLASAVAALAVTAAGVASAADINLTFRFNDSEAEEMRAALDDFEAENPGVEVELQTIAWSESRQQFLREAAVGEGPDVVHIAFVWPRDMGAAGALLPINTFLESDPIQGGFDDFIATELAVGADDNIYGVPWTTDTWAMIYHTGVLADAGIDKIPTNWEELRDASRTIHEKTGKVGFGFPGGSGPQNTIWFLANYYWWSNNQALVVPDGDGFKTGITVDEIAAAMEYYDSFIKEGHNPEAMLGVTEWFDPVILEGIISGEQGIAIVPPQQAKQILAAFQERNPGVEPPFVTATTPGGPAGPKTHLGGRMLGINSNTENPEMAWKLVEFMTRTDVLTKYYGNQFPAQKTPLGEIEFGPALAGFAEQLTLARSWGAYSDGPAQIGTMWNDTGRAFGSAFIGERSYQEAAAQLLESVEDQLK